jgi:formylglycine-generating enzyme required for sulfatase activity
MKIFVAFFFITVFPAVYADVQLPADVRLDGMVNIPGGTFTMGGVEANEGPVHTVVIKPFQLSKYEVTFDQYDAFARETNRPLPADNGWGRGNNPVINVSWYDANAYVQWLNSKADAKFRLPSEAEWEYACRGGTGNLTYCGSNDLNSVAWFAENSNAKVHSVGQKQANGYGLFDMSGNVWEWTEDCYHDSYVGAPNDGAAWTTGGSCDMRVFRGGSWNYAPQFLRAAFRGRMIPTKGGTLLGFRVARTP